MKKRLICMLLFVLMIVSLFAGTSVSASAETVSYSTMTYRMVSGDYVLRICQRLDLNYYVCKTAIMKLNNINSDDQFRHLPVGKLLTLPSTDADAVVITTGHGSTAKTTTTTATSTAAASTIAASTPTNATVSASSSGDPIWFWIVPYELHTGETLTDAMNALGMSGTDFRDSIKKINQIKDWGASRTDTSILLPTYYPPSSNFSRITVYAHMMRAGETPANVVTARGLNYTKIKGILDILNEKYGGVASVQTGQRLFYPIASTGKVYGKGTDGSYELLSDLNSADGTVEFYVDGTRVYGAKPGTTVKFVLKPAKGKAVKDIVLKFANGQADMFLTGDSFTMPSCDVRLSASFQSGHSITLQPNYEGRAAARVDGVNVSSAAKGARVMVVSTDPSLEIKELYVNYTTLTGAKREQVTNIDQGFVMPDYDVTIEVVLGPVQTYNLFVIDDGVNDARIGQAINANGKFSLQVNGVKVTSAARGTEVKIVFEPDPGYTVGAVWVFNHNANVPVGVFNNTFTMPNQDVDVGVRFDPKGNNILINPVEGGQFYATLNAADPNPSTIANRNANAVDEAQTNQRVFINWVPEVAGGPYAMSNVPDDFVVTRNSDGLRIPVTIDANGVWFRMPAGGATVTGGVVPAAQTYTARVFLDGVLIPNGQFKDVSFYTKGDNAAERSEFRDGSGVEVKTNQATVATNAGEYIKLTYKGGAHITPIRYEVWDAAEANMLAEETNQANKADHCFKMPGQNVVIYAYFSSSVVKIDAKDITVKSGSGTVGALGLAVPGADPTDPTSWNAVAGVNVGDPFAISVSPSEGYFFDTANAATKLRVVRKDNGGEIPLVQDGNANPIPGTDGEWIYRYTAMPDCGVKVEVVFDKIVYWVQLNTVDQFGAPLNAAGYWKFTVNSKDNLVENSITDVFVEYGDTVSIALTEAGASKFTFVNSIINNVTSKDTSFTLSGALARAAGNLNNQTPGQPLVVTLTLKNKALSGMNNPIHLSVGVNDPARGSAGFAITQFSPYNQRGGAAPDPTANATEAYAGDTVAIIPQPVTPAKYRATQIRIFTDSKHYEELDLTNPVDIGGQNGYTFVMPEGGYSGIYVRFDPVPYNLTVDKTPTDASKGLFQVSYNDGTTTGDVLFAGSFKQVPYGSTVKITLTKPGTDAKLKINGITLAPDTPDGGVNPSASIKPTTKPATTYTFTMPAEDTTVTVNLVDKDGGTTGVPKGDPDPTPITLPTATNATGVTLEYYKEDGTLITDATPKSGDTVKAKVKGLKEGEKLDGPIVIKDKNGNTVATIEDGVAFEVPYVDASGLPLKDAEVKVEKKQFKITINASNAKPADCDLNVKVYRNGSLNSEFTVKPGTTVTPNLLYGDKLNIDASAASKRDVLKATVNGTESGTPTNKKVDGVEIAPAGVEDGGAVTVNVEFKVDTYTLTSSDGKVKFYDNAACTGTAIASAADGDTVYVKGAPANDWNYPTKIEVTIGTEAAKTVADGASIVVTGNVTANLTESKEKVITVKVVYDGQPEGFKSFVKYNGATVSETISDVKHSASSEVQVLLDKPDGYEFTFPASPTKFSIDSTIPYQPKFTINWANVSNGETVEIELGFVAPPRTLPATTAGGTPVTFYKDAALTDKITGTSVEDGTEVYAKVDLAPEKYLTGATMKGTALTVQSNGACGPYKVTQNLVAADFDIVAPYKAIKLLFDYKNGADTKVNLYNNGALQTNNTSIMVSSNGSVSGTAELSKVKLTTTSQFGTVQGTNVTVSFDGTKENATFALDYAKIANGATVTIEVNVD